MAVTIQVDTTSLVQDTSRGQWDSGRDLIVPAVISTTNQIQSSVYTLPGCHGQGTSELYNAAGTLVASARGFSAPCYLWPIAAGSAGDRASSRGGIAWNVDTTNFGSGSKIVFSFGGSGKNVIDGLRFYVANSSLDGTFVRWTKVFNTTAGGIVEIEIPFQVADV